MSQSQVQEHSYAYGSSIKALSQSYSTSLGFTVSLQTSILSFPMHKSMGIGPPQVLS